VVTASFDRQHGMGCPDGEPLTEPLRHEARFGLPSSSRWAAVVTGCEMEIALTWSVTCGCGCQTGKPLTKPLHVGEFLPVQSGWAAVVTASWTRRCGSGMPGPRAARRTARAIRNAVELPQFSPDGLRVVIASSREARVWDAQTGKPLNVLLPHGGIVNSAQFSPDGLRWSPRPQTRRPGCGMPRRQVPHRIAPA